STTYTHPKTYTLSLHDALPISVAEEDDDVAVEEVAACVEGERRVGAEVYAVRPDCGGQRQVNAAPVLAAVRREVAAHRQAEDFVRAGGDVLRLRRVDGDEGLALRAALVGDVDVAAEGD